MVVQIILIAKMIIQEIRFITERSCSVCSKQYLRRIEQRSQLFVFKHITTQPAAIEPKFTHTAPYAYMIDYICLYLGTPTLLGDNPLGVAYYVHSQYRSNPCLKQSVSVHKSRLQQSQRHIFAPYQRQLGFGQSIELKSIVLHKKVKFFHLTSV